MNTLFIAEDDAMMSRMYERAFRHSGHEMTLATNGEEALTLLTDMEEKPLIILLDVMMPRMNGFDLLRKLKEDANFKKIPVILLSNLAGKQDIEKGLALGADSYLIKSDYTPKEIVEKVEETIKKYKLQ